MFNKFELKVGIRYLRAKQKNTFVSFISLVSIIGITLGVAALITVLSVMNGFQKEIRAKIIGATSHMQIKDLSGVLDHWREVPRIFKAEKNIIGYAPFVDGQALVAFDGNVSGVLIRGMDPNFEPQVDDIKTHMKAGKFDDLVPKEFRIIIGDGLAQNLGVRVGDKITLVTPEGQSTPAGVIPRLKQFTVCGIFKLNMYEYDSGLALLNLNDAQALFKFGNSISGIRLKVKDVMDTQQIKRHLEEILPSNLIVSDWISEHQNYFAAVSLEKKMMFVILTLIIAVATFNLVSTLVMTVNEKKSDIAILRTIGASKKNIMNIFIIQGGISGLIGSVGGTLLGLLLSYNIGKIVHLIEVLFHKQLINPDVYFIDYLPSEVQFIDVVSIFSISLILSIIATLYPSIKAANTDPVEALRYE